MMAAFKWISQKIKHLKELIFRRKEVKPIDVDTLNELIEDAGFVYEPKQDIFYSSVNAWQRDMGYCRLYDEAAAPLGMIIDCEPIYFTYGGKRWLIEFWKGQYGLSTGGEIGIYTTEDPDINIPDFFNGTFYNAASDEDMLQIYFILRKDHKTLFSRESRHWWHTGFIVGEFSQPWELSMQIKMKLKDVDMCNEFLKGLKEAGYNDDEILVEEREVQFTFDKPRTPQPISRTKEIDNLIQKKNKLMCDKYQEITKSYDKFLDKINAIGKEAPELYNLILNIGKTKKLFNSYDIIKKFLD